MNAHQATPEQWRDAGVFASDTHACLLELRERIAALEAAANSSASLTSSNHPEIPDDSRTAADRLVERVAGIIINGVACDHSEERTARSTVLAIAHWLDRQGIYSNKAAASYLRREVECG